jgi:hypothetical protein
VDKMKNINWHQKTSWLKLGQIVNHAKIIIVVLLLALALMPLNTASAAGETTVSVSSPTVVNPGEQFTVDIIVEPGTAIAGVQFDLAFDPSIVTASSVTEGNLLSQGGANTYFQAGTIDNVAGTISGVSGVITTPGQTVSSSGMFAAVTMTAGALGGISALTLSDVVVGDINGQAVVVIVVSGQVATNNAPELDAIGGQSTDEGLLLTFTISGSDADGDPLVYSATGLPGGASFNATTRVFSWTPRYDQAGVYVVRFTVSDGELSDFEDVTVTVVQPYPDWDVNWDGAANVLDMVLVGQHWGEVGLTGWIREDANEDGTANVLDMIIIGQHWTD